MIGLDVRFKMLKGLLTEIMFKSAGIFGSRFFIDADSNEPVGEDCMTLINACGGGSALLGKGYIAVLVHFYKAALFEKSDSTAYARL